MKPSRAKTPARPQGRLHRTGSNQKVDAEETEEVSVCCRIRPIGNSEQRCAESIDDKTLQLLPPYSSRAFFNGRVTQHTFKKVFNEDSSQSEVFAECGLPLVRDLLLGRNGLLFTYGVTGSGKTYTMQGSPSDGGIMTRAIDVIFNSIDGLQTSHKFIIESDKLNDFQIQPAADAAIRHQQELMLEMRGTNRYAFRNNNSDPNLSERLPDETKVETVDQNCVYGVFVSYCEVYNKYIYDLLDDSKDPVTGRYKFESKSLREDAHGNMFVSGSTEKEVRSAKEALDLFYKGQRKRRVAQTQLNLESSRSHSIFNIRLVKCYPLSDDEIDPTKPCLVSQLALVDLAGSERTSRTGNTGERLREAGNINNSLMNLRACIEKLRENQKSGRKGNVPYRNDKITHLFRNYFEGSGVVKMIVTINPRIADYEENLNVLQFAELTQEVELDRHDPVLREFNMTPAKQRVQLAYETALNRAETNVDVEQLNPNFNPIYSLGPPWPAMDWQGFNDEETIPALLRYLEQRVVTRNTLTQDHKEKQEEFRQRLVTLEKEAVLLKEENKRLKAGWDGEKRRNVDLETRLVNAEAANTSLQRRVEAFCEAKVVLESELDEKEMALNQQKKDTKREVRRLRSQISSEKTHAKRSFEESEQEYKDVGSRIAEWKAKFGGSEYSGTKRTKR